MEEFILLTKFYDLKLVLASIFIAIAGSYASLEINHKLARQSQSTLFMLAIASLTMGLSIWSMHFIGMAAFSIPVEVSYRLDLTFLSIVPAVLAAIIAFYTIYFTQAKVWQMLLAGLAMGAGISSMHYIGMAAINYSGFIQYDKSLFILSLLIAVVVSFVALYLLRILQTIQNRWITIPVAFLMGLAISGMHYTGMASSEFCLPVMDAGLILNEPTRSFEFLGIITAIIVCASILFLLVSMRAERRFLKRMAYRDSLTGLYNRRWFQENFRKLFTSTTEETVWILIDLDRFKWVNETFGYDKGDEVLVQLSHRFVEVLDDRGLAIHYEGTQFLLLTRGKTNQVNAVCKEIQALMKKPFRLLGNELSLTVSMGVYQPRLNLEVATPTDITKPLELALHAAKRNGRDNWTIYDEEKHSDKREQLIVDQLHISLDTKEEFYLCYQPKVHLVTKEINSAEVLLRWDNQVLGFVSPAEFIPIAEKHGLIQELTSWVFATACLQLKEWKKRDFFIERLAINLSATYFQFENGNEMITEILKRTKIDPHDIHIELEITETAIMENLDRAILMLTELKEMGMTIALDDFGAGLSSLTYLKHLPIDTLKMDKAFVDGIPKDDRDNAIAEFIVSMARKIGITVVAEGIETKEQDDYLRKISCHYGQGYLYSKPKTKEEIETFKVEDL